MDYYIWTLQWLQFRTNHSMLETNLLSVTSYAGYKFSLLHKLQKKNIKNIVYGLSMYIMLFVFLDIFKWYKVPSCIYVDIFIFLTLISYYFLYLHIICHVVRPFWIPFWSSSKVLTLGYLWQTKISNWVRDFFLVASPKCSNPQNLQKSPSIILF